MPTFPWFFSKKKKVCVLTRFLVLFLAFDSLYQICSFYTSVKIIINTWYDS